MIYVDDRVSHPLALARRQAMRAWDHTYQAWLRERIYAGDLRLPHDQTVTVLVGYDPQKLLPSPERLMREYFERATAMFTREFMEHGEAIMRFESIPLFAPGDEIKMTPLPTPRWSDLYGPDDGVLRPWPKREPTFRHQVAIVRGSDFSHAEMRALLDNPHVRGIVLDMEVDRRIRYEQAVTNALFHVCIKPQEPERVATAAGKRDMGYLKHDRTKNHKRRRR